MRVHHLWKVDLTSTLFININSCITKLKAQGPSRTCNGSKEEEEVYHLWKVDLTSTLFININSSTSACAGAPNVNLRSKWSRLVSRASMYRRGRCYTPQKPSPVRETVVRRKKIQNTVWCPLSSECGTYETAKARFWLWLSGKKSLKPLQVLPVRSEEDHPVWGPGGPFGCWVWGFVFLVKSSVRRAWGEGCRVWGVGCGVWGVVCRL